MAERQMPRPTNFALQGKSAFSNGNRPFLVPKGNTVPGRRLIELRREFGEEVGGSENLPAQGKHILHRLAHVSLELELLEAKSVSGTPIDPVHFIGLIKEQRKLLRDLDTFRPKPIETGSFDDHLDRTYGAAK